MPVIVARPWAIFALPLSKTQRDPAEYKPNKRAQIRRRHLLESDIEDRIREGIAPLLRAPDPERPAARD